MKVGTFLLVTVTALAGCSSVPTNQPNAVHPENAAAPVLRPSGSPPNSNGGFPQANAVPYPGLSNIDPAASQSPGKNVNQPNTQNRANPIPHNGRPAPYDSYFYSTMNAKGEAIEVRVFNSHPVLARAERTFNGSISVYRVFLRNGTAVEAPAAQMTDFAGMSPDSILTVIGMIEPPVSEPRKPGKKEDR